MIRLILTPANISTCPWIRPFPFGHGLSFSRVELENPRASRETFRPQDRILVEVDAINKAGAATEETIFLFVHDLAASVARPLLELKDWAEVAWTPDKQKPSLSL